VADTHQAFGQNVDQKSVQKLIYRDGHDFLLATMGIVFPTKRDAIILEGKRHTHCRVVRYLDSEPYVHKADASDSEPLVLVRHGQNVWGIATGRRNWIHIGSEQAGPRVAAILSVVESCRRLKVPIRDYLGNILPGLAQLPQFER
jgi:hypothetical protein